MKITKQQLKKIIKEELENVLEGQSEMFSRYGLQGPGDWGTGDPVPLGSSDDPKKSEIAQIVSFNMESGTVDAAIQQLENAQFLYDDVSDYYQTLTDEGVMRFANAILNGMQQDQHPGYHEY